jgi:hypothetical protein
MAALLAVCTEVEQRAVIRFLWSEGVPGAEIHQNSHRIMAWKHPGLPTKNKYKTQSSAGMMLTVFWDSKRPIQEDYLEKGCIALCSSLAHTASGAAMLTLSHQLGN